jgi:hypothetical protein
LVVVDAPQKRYVSHDQGELMTAFNREHHPVVVVPFWMFLARYGSTIYEDFTARHRQHREEDLWQTADTFTSMIAGAYLGAFERGGYILGATATREERLQFAREVLTPDEYETLLAVAVPQPYREMAAIDLEQMVRTGSAEDRVWAATWLALVGWIEGDECSFAVMPHDRIGVMESLIEEALAAEGEERERTL